MSYVADLKDGPEVIMKSRYEFLSKYIFYFGSLLNFFPLVFIVFSFLTLGIIYKCIERFSANKIVSWVIYYSFPLFFLSSLSTIRQSLATVVVLYSYRFVKEMRYGLFLFIILLGSQIHISAVVGLLLLPLTIYPPGRFLNILFFVGSFFASEFIYNYLANVDIQFASVTRLQSYIFDYQNVKPNKLIYIYYIIGLFNLVFFNKLISMNANNKYYIVFFNFGVLLLNLLSFEPISSLRISAFFMVFIIYIVPEYLLMFIRSDRSFLQVGVVLSSLILSYYFIYLYIDSYNRNLLEKVSFVPYRSWLFISTDL
jgi:hypothetical protein